MTYLMYREVPQGRYVSRIKPSNTSSPVRDEIKNIAHGKYISPILYSTRI